MKLYDVDGYDRPLLLSEEHAAIINAREHIVETAMPTRSASKQTWLDYALAIGGDPLELSELTKSELVEQYGS